MIENARVAYGASEPFIRRWELESATLNALLIAFLTTLLSYQAASAIFDIFLGIKPRLRATVANLQTLLLVRQLSPLAAVSNLLRNDYLTRRRFHLPPSTDLSMGRRPDAESIRKRVTFKLLFLLGVAPLVNFLAVLLTIENRRNVTFGEARFGGLALGIDEIGTGLVTEPLSEGCRLAPISLELGEDPLVEFSICTVGRQTVPRERLAEDEVEVLIYPMLETSLIFQAYRGRRVWTSGSTAYVFADKTIRYVSHGVTNETAETFVDYGMKLWADECGMQNANDAVDVTDELVAIWPPILPPPFVVKRMKCKTLPDNGDLARISSALEKKITLIDSDELRGITVELLDEVAEKGGLTAKVPFKTSEGFNLLERRRRNLSVLALGILTVFVVAVRTLTAVVCHNDLDKGLEMIMKMRLGLRCCDSILWRYGAEVSYNAKEAPGRVLYSGDDVFGYYITSGNEKDGVDNT